MEESEKDYIKIKIPNKPNITILDVAQALGKKYYTLCESSSGEDCELYDHYVNIIKGPNEFVNCVKKRIDSCKDDIIFVAELYEQNNSVYVDLTVDGCRVKFIYKISIHGVNKKERKKLIKKVEKLGDGLFCRSDTESKSEDETESEPDDELKEKWKIIDLFFKKNPGEIDYDGELPESDDFFPVFRRWERKNKKFSDIKISGDEYNKYKRMNDYNKYK